MKRYLLIALLGLALGSQARAVTPESAPVETLDAGLIAAMKAGSAGTAFATRNEALSAVVAQSYDLPTVTQNSVGFLWATLPPAQQQQLIQLIGQFTTTSYTTQFNSYGGETFNVLPDEKTLGAGYIIQSKLNPGGSGDPVELDYVVHKTPQGWRITDVLLNGTISQVALHNSDFASLVTSGDASKLITALQAKIVALQNSSAAN
jgi:phospholipid transport system substrate-binding protein